MALQGSLKDLRLGDVLQTILQTGNQGRLHVRSQGRRAVLHVAKDGLRILEPEILDERMILDAFLHRGTIDEALLARTKASPGAKNSTPLEALLAAGAIPRREHDALVGDVAEDCVLDVLAWSDGDFRFEEGGDLSETKSIASTVTLEPAGLLLRAAQRMDERKRIAEHLGRHAILVSPLGDGSPPPEGLDAMSACVLARIDGKKLLKEIALTEGLTLFVAQKAAAILVEHGAARLPTSDELAALASDREKLSDVRAAMGLLWQWQAQHPQETKPLESVAALAGRSGRPEDEAEALKALGKLCLKTGKPKEAKDVFERLLKRRPGDRDGLEGLCLASHALADTDTFVRSSFTLAEMALEAGDAQRCSTLLQTLLEVKPDDLAARVLRTKAFVRLNDRAQAISECEQIAAALPPRCRKTLHREAASYCRDTLAALAPDRSDLLRTFRGMVESGALAKKRVLIVSSLLVALSGVGFVLWPRPAASLLDRARDAVARGDTSTALTILSELDQKFPDSTENDEGISLKARITATAAPPERRPDADALKGLLTATERVRLSLIRWPQTSALEEAEELIALLRTPEGSSATARREVAYRLRGPLADEVAQLRRAALERRDALDMAPKAAGRPPGDLETFRTIAEAARSALDPAWAEAARRGAATARRLGGYVLEGDSSSAALAEDLRYLEADVESAARAMTARAPDVDRVRREYHRALVADAYDVARGEAVKLLVRGDLNAAEVYYSRLAKLLSAIEDDPALRSLKDTMDRRGILGFSHAKMEMMKTIRAGLAAAGEAEKTGNLPGAARSYAKLVQQFPLVRFDEVFTIPMRVVTVPPGAKVSINGKEIAVEAGKVPVARYGWGSQTALTVTADGYEAASVVLRTAEAEPEPEVRVHLLPLLRWTQPVVGVVESPMLAVGGDVVVCNRSGRVERRSSASGEVLWSSETKSVEGIRGRPALAGDTIFVPLVEGSLARVSAGTGTALPLLTLQGRPVGDAASVKGRAAIAMENQVAVYLENSDTPTLLKMAANVTAGVLSAHDAFWVGDAAGGITRIDPVTLTSRTISSGGDDPIVALAVGGSSVYALAGDGTLYSVDPRTKQSVLWKRPGLGDVADAPAEAGGLVAVADRTGHVKLFSATDGAPKGERVLGSPTRGGILSVSGCFVAYLHDGRVFVYNVAQGTTTVDANTRGTCATGPVCLDDDLIVVPAFGNGLGTFSLPK